MNNDDIRARERRAREYLTKKEMARRARRWKKEARREAWGEIFGGLLIWVIILILIWL